MTLTLARIDELDAASRRGRRPPGADPVEPLPPAVFPGRTPLRGQRVALEPVDPRRHAEELFAIGHADAAAVEVWRYVPYGPFADVASMTSWLRGCAGASETVFLALREMAENRLMGMASFLEIRPLIGVVEIGHIWFAPPFQRSAAATEALFLMMSHVLDDLGYRRLEWKCNALNLASRRAALRLGFRHEGVFLNHNIVKGRNRDTAWYSIAASEWQDVRAALEAWLSPANFDDEGRQRSALSAATSELW